MDFFHSQISGQIWMSWTKEFESSTATLMVIFTPEYKLNGHDEKRVHIPFCFIDDDSH